MADLEKTVAIIFEGIDMMGDGIDSATKQIGGLSQSVETATQPMADATIGILKFEAAVAATGLAVTAFAVKLAGDFDSQFREISTLIDAPAESLQGFKNEILEYSTESSKSLSDINSSLYNAISAGVDYTDSLEAVAQAEKMSIAGKATLDQSLIVLVSSLNAYGQGMDQAETFSDLLFTTVKNGVTTLPELGSSLANVTGLAASAGVSFEELLAAVATLTATGTPTSQAMTQIRGAISNIIKPTSDATNLATDLGFEFNATALQTKGLAGVLIDAAEATGGSTEQMARLFGSVEALNGVLTLTGLGAESFADNIESMANNAGATEEAYQKMAGTVEQGNQRIQNSIAGVLISIGDPLLEAFGGIQEAIAAIFNAIGASITGGQLEDFVNELEGMFEAIERTLLDVAKNLPEALEQADFSSFFDGIEAIREAVAALFDGANLSSVEGLVSVIETLGLGFQALAEYTAGAITALGPFIEKVAELAGWFLELDPVVFAVIGAIGGLSLALNTLAGILTATATATLAFGGKGGAVAKSTGMIRGLIGVLSGPVGLLAATGLVVKGVYDAGQSFFGMEERVAEATKEIRAQNEAIDSGALEWDTISKSWVEAGTAQETLTEQVQRWNKEASNAILGISDQNTALDEHQNMLEEVNRKYTNWDQVVEDAWKSSAQFAKEQEATADSLKDVLAAIGPIEGAWKQVSAGVFESTNNIGELESAYAEVKAAFEEGLITQQQFDDITEYYNSLRSGAEDGKQSQQELAEEVLSSEEAILKARQAILDYQLSMEELASNERIKNMEFFVALNVAEIEADAKKVEAILEATSLTITELGGTINDMFGNLSDLSRSDQIDMERAIKQQMEIQRQAADDQSALIQAQIEQMRAKTDALRNGDGLINISSDGLEPALEMIMWQIIEKVQMRANAEGAEFLLGLGV